MDSCELAFRQLTEQLWVAGLPSSKTACSQSVRSRCSSVPPSERGDYQLNETNTFGSKDGNHDEKESLVDRDEPYKPDKGNVFL